MECQLDVTLPGVVVLVIGDTDNPRKVHKYTGYGKRRNYYVKLFWGRPIYILFSKVFIN